jgi:K+-transporting ATPase ATPase C chain
MLKTFGKETWSAVRITVVLLVLLGLIYPVVVWGIGQVVFNKQANGSIITNSQGQAVGSSLIGQQFTKPEYFHGRPSATLDANGKPLPYNASNSAASNLGPTNPQLVENAKGYIEQYQQENNLGSDVKLPADVVSASGSGLDPHISVENATLQAARVATARNLKVEDVKTIIQQHTNERDLGILGEVRVNVLELNLALDALQGKK